MSPMITISVLNGVCAPFKVQTMLCTNDAIHGAPNNAPNYAPNYALSLHKLFKGFFIDKKIN